MDELMVVCGVLRDECDNVAVYAENAYGEQWVISWGFVRATGGFQCVGSAV